MNVPGNLLSDISIWLHQVVKGFQDQKGNALPNAHLLGLFNRLCKLLFYRIKPIFVFDGSTPALKRETIAKRSQSRSKHLTEADRIQQLLLSSLAKEKIVQQALGVSAETLIQSPTKSPRKKFQAADPDAIFKLPEMKVDLNKSDETSEDTTEDDCSIDEESSYYKNLKSIDVNSVHFKTLPADIRYDILQEITETRKHASWGTLHELPVQSTDFCSFQMKQLLKRHQVQQRLEEAEKEIGGACLSLDVLEQFFTEDGFESLDKKEAEGGKMASDETTRFILVRDLKKAMETQKKEDLLDPGEGTSRSTINNLNEPRPRDEQSDDEEDTDLQRAIQMSLADDVNVVELNRDQRCDDPLKFTTQQKTILSDAAKSLARGFILEHGGLTNEEYDELLERNENGETVDCNGTTFRYNDKFIVRGDDGSSSQAADKLESEKQLELNKSPNECDLNSISSDADSDFVDVADMADFESPSMQVFPVFPMTADLPDTTDMSRDFRLYDLEKKPLEVIIKLDEKPNVDDDIFADIFVTNADEVIKKQEVKPNDEKKKNMNDILAQLKREKENITKIDLDSIVVDAESMKMVSAINTNVDIEKLMQESVQDTAITIDDETEEEEVDSQATIIDEELTKLNEKTLNNVIEIDDVGETDEEKAAKSKVQSEIDRFFTVERTPEKKPVSTEDEEEVVPKVASPFFMNRTPGGSAKKMKNTPKKSLNPEEKSKVSKSLFPETAEDIITIASDELRLAKSKGELETMMSEINHEKGELETEQNRQTRFGSSITQQMNTECMSLLRLFGVPYIVAPMEAEAQCAFLNHIRLTDGTITDDSDIWLFGGQTVYKNFFNNKKHVMEFRIENIEKLFSLDRKKMIQVAMLVGSDYTTGITGIGAVTALEILAAFPSVPVKEGETTECMSTLSGLRRFRDWIKEGRTVSSSSTRNSLKGKLKNIEISEGFPYFNVAEAYLYPTVNEEKDAFTWGYPDAVSICEFTKKNFGWTKLKTDETLLPVLKKLDDRKTQQSIKNFFHLQSTPTSKNLLVSKRVKKAIEKMSGRVESEDETTVVKIKKPRKRAAPKKGKSSQDVTAPNTNVEDVVDLNESENFTPPKSQETRKRKSPEPCTLTNQNSDDDGEAISWKTLETKGPVSTRNTSKLSLSAKINKNSSIAIDPTAIVAGPSRTKIPRIPNTKLKIPQREKDNEQRESNRLKAIEVFKKSKDNKN